MTHPNLRHRSREAELMDNPDVSPADLDHAMHHLEIINRLLNGYGPTMTGIKQMLTTGQNSFKLLDVGCGSGDTLRHIARWCRRQKINVSLTGIELSARSAERAATACMDFPEIEIRQQDLFAISPASQYDIVHNALVLHHFSSDDDVLRALHHMAELSTMGIIINDLHRHPAAYHSIRLLTRIFSQSPILQNDAPLSVARAFTRSELENFAAAAGLSNVNVEWHWAFRWLMTCRHDTRPPQ